MKREFELVKNTVILAIGTLVPKLIALITLPILTGYLTKSEYGLFDLVVTLVTVMLPIATLQIQSAAFRFLIECRSDKEKTNEIVTNIFSVIIPISLVVISATFFLLHSVSITNRLFICIYYFADIVYLTLQQITRGLSLNFHYSVASILLSVSNMLLILILVWYVRMGLRGVLIGSFVSYTVSSLYLINVIRKRIKINIRKYFSWLSIKEMLNYSWPMIPNNLSNWILGLSDRFIIAAALGVSTNAVYAVAQKIPNLYSNLQGTVTLAWQENASIASSDKDSVNYYSTMFERAFSLYAGSLGCLMAVSPWIFDILIAGDYKASYYQMPILFIGIFFSCLSAFLGAIYVAQKQIKSVGLTTMCAAFINLVTNMLLIRNIGIYAASISTLISYFLLLVFRMIDLHRKYGISYKYSTFILDTAGLFTISFLLYQNERILNILNLCIAVLFLLFINRNIVKKIKKRFLKKLD
jgi:O-antigen/teichoic acid export membrane protein